MLGKTGFDLPRYSFFSVLACIMALLVVSPLITGVLGSLLVNFLFTLLMLSMIYILANESKGLMIGLCLAIPSVIIHWINYFQETHTFYYVSSAFSLAFLGYTIVFLFKKVFFSRRLHADLIFGALCLYFLAGIFWAVLYGVVELFAPGSFKGIPEMHPTELGESMRHFHKFLYFSYVTMSTLGFGDIVPVNPEVRNIVVIEAILGQFYIATLVAGLIGMLIRKDVR